MKILALLAALLCALPLTAQDRTWLLDRSTLTYHMSHPLHEVDGTSHGALGKGLCHAGACNFLVAAPVRSFESGDSNRDLHMLQVTRGAQFPIVSVRLALPESVLSNPDIFCDIDVEFAGNTAHYARVPIHQVIEGAEHHITGAVPATLADFKIPAPTFFTVPIKNEIPVRLDLYWHAQ